MRLQNEVVIDPRSYHRYDDVVATFEALDTEGMVALYKDLKPLMDEAYRQLGYPEGSFGEPLEKAIIHLLGTPDMPEQVPLTEKVVTYAFQSDTLETQSAARKHLLRMGPENMRKTKAKLRSFATALGMDTSRFPAP